MSEITESPAQSPTAVKTKPASPGAVDFPEAMRAVRDGNTVTKDEWADPKIQVKLVNEKVMIKLSDDLWHPLIINYGDLTGDDWRVI